MSAVFNFFRKDVGGGDDTRDVNYGSSPGSSNIADLGLVEVDVFGVFVGEGDGPIDCSLIVVVDGNGLSSVGHVKVCGHMPNAFEGGDQFVDGHNLSFTGALRSLLLVDGAPGDGAAAVADEIARQGAEFEEFERGAILDSVAELATSACVAVSS